VFGSYQPVNSTLDIEKLRKEVEKLPEKKEFDETFTIAQEVVKKRRRTKISLTDQIDLEIKDSIDDDAIRSASLKDGTKGVFIRTDTGFENFQGAQIVIPKVATLLKFEKASGKGQQTKLVSN